VCENSPRYDVLSSKDFRRIALGMKDAAEGAHMGHPDFRTGGRIFATIHPDHASGMVNLTPNQQEKFVREHPAFTPENGAWGRQGCTRVLIDAVDEDTLGEAMTLAWQNTARPGAARRAKPGGQAKPGGRAKLSGRVKSSGRAKPRRRS
jgi:hypothetical protein